MHPDVLRRTCRGAGAGTPAPKTYKIYAVCDAHLDTQWNWDLTHTIREYIPRILFQNLWMLERYPDYKFNFEGGIIYRWMKEYYPLHYARLQKYIDEGRWHISGASWNANDPNMPSAESFIRNILQGQELYKREFGVRSTDIFLPDCFGFGYTLPSLAAHCGLIGFSTQKLSWRKHDFFPDAPYHKKNPFSWGVWYGIDGQSLMAAFDTGGYTAELPADAGYNKDFIRRASNGFDNTAMRYYSGGPLRPDRFLDPEAELAQARLLPRRTLSQEEPLLVGRMVRYRRAVAHGGLRYGRVYRRTAGRRGV